MASPTTTLTRPPELILLNNAIVRVDHETGTSIPAGLLNIDEVQAVMGVSRATVYEWMAVRGFPRPRKLGRCNRWPADEVEEWYKAQPLADVQVREETATVA